MSILPWAFGHNRFLEVIWGTPDHERLKRCFACVARGIYYHEFGQAFTGGLQVLLGHLHYTDANSAQFVRFIRDGLKLELSAKPACGHNPQVFHYQITQPDVFGLRTVRLCFYAGIEIYVALIPAGTE